MKGYTLEWLGPALDDIAEIAQYLKAEAGIDASEKMVNKLIQEINDLIDFAYANPYTRYKTLREKGYRVLIINHYLCFYKVLGKTISIYRVLHGSREIILNCFVKSAPIV